MTTEHHGPMSGDELDLLRRKALGQLSEAEALELEARMAEDPMLRDAAEGLAMPGAWAAATAMRAPSVVGGSGRWGWAVGTALLILVALGLRWYTASQPPATVAPPQAPMLTEQASPAPEPLPSSQAVEAATTTEVFDAEPTGTRERFERPVAHAVVRSTPPEPLQPVPAPALVRDADGSLRPGRNRSWPIVYLHDLKVVHPDALHPAKPNAPVNGNVPADRERAGGDARPWKDEAPDRHLRYLDYMDRPMGALARGDMATALAGFAMLLEQYPNDLNGQFYSGLARYRSGAYTAALPHLRRARAHRVDAFAEEAAWYEALCTEAVSGAAAAAPLYGAIAEGRGFYAARAAQQLGGHTP